MRPRSHRQWGNGERGPLHQPTQPQLSAVFPGPSTFPLLLNPPRPGLYSVTCRFLQAAPMAIILFSCIPGSPARVLAFVQRGRSGLRQPGRGKLHPTCHWRTGFLPWRIQGAGSQGQPILLHVSNLTTPSQRVLLLFGTTTRGHFCFPAASPGKGGGHRPDEGLS